MHKTMVVSFTVILLWCKIKKLAGYLLSVIYCWFYVFKKQ